MEGISVEQAVEQILQHTPVINETEETELNKAGGRVLAQDMVAGFDNPPFDRSPVDGYACKAEDLAGAAKEHPVRLKVMEEIDAGQYSEREIQQGQAVRIMTGDEVVELGIPLPEGKIYNSNMTMLSARLRELGIESFHMEAVKDDPTVMSEKLKEAAKAADMIITTGGVSVGKKDIMHESLRLMGAERIFWRVKMKPGMPTLFSAYKKTSDITATDHCASEREIPIISLSGNPFGVAVSIELLIRPALEKMMQDPSIGLKEVNGIMADNFEKGIKGRRFIRAYLENGKFHLPNGLHSNGVLSSMAGCNCLIDTKTMENQESRSLNAGDKVGAILL